MFKKLYIFWEALLIFWEVLLYFWETLPYYLRNFVLFLWISAHLLRSSALFLWVFMTPQGHRTNSNKSGRTTHFFQEPNKSGRTTYFFPGTQLKSQWEQLSFSRATFSKNMNSTSRFPGESMLQAGRLFYSSRWLLSEIPRCSSLFLSPLKIWAVLPSRLIELLGKKWCSPSKNEVFSRNIFKNEEFLGEIEEHLQVEN